MALVGSCGVRMRGFPTTHNALPYFLPIGVHKFTVGGSDAASVPTPTAPAQDMEWPISNKLSKESLQGDLCTELMDDKEKIMRDKLRDNGRNAGLKKKEPTEPLHGDTTMPQLPARTCFM